MTGSMSSGRRLLLVLIGLALTLLGLAGWAMLMHVPWLRTTAATAWVGIALGLACTGTGLRGGSRFLVKLVAAAQVLLPAFFVIWFFWLSQLPATGSLDGLQRAPDFTLPNQDGKQVTLAQELAKGPVLLIFYRGHW